MKMGIPKKRIPMKYLLEILCSIQLAHVIPKINAGIRYRRKKWASPFGTIFFATIKKLTPRIARHIKQIKKYNIVSILFPKIS